VARVISVYGLEDTTVVEEPDTVTPIHLQKRKPLQARAKLEAIDHEMSKQKINNLMSQIDQPSSVGSAPAH